MFTDNLSTNEDIRATYSTKVRFWGLGFVVWVFLFFLKVTLTCFIHFNSTDFFRQIMFT